MILHDRTGKEQYLVPLLHVNHLPLDVQGLVHVLVQEVHCIIKPTGACHPALVELVNLLLRGQLKHAVHPCEDDFPSELHQGLDQLPPGAQALSDDPWDDLAESAAQTVDLHLILKWEREEVGISDDKKVLRCTGYRKGTSRTPPRP